MTGRFDLLPGVTLWPGKLDALEQVQLLSDILDRVGDAPFYRPVMPRSGRPLSVEMTNFGSLGWMTDQARGYRYEPNHPLTGRPWPAIPEGLLALWRETASYPALPEACLVNLYRGSARMGLHCDQDEAASDAPVLSVSLGDAAIFRFAMSRRGPSETVKLGSGDVLIFGGPARRLFHGVDRIQAGGSTLIPGGGRINLTLRRVTKPSGIAK